MSEQVPKPVPGNTPTPAVPYSLRARVGYPYSSLKVFAMRAKFFITCQSFCHASKVFHHVVKVFITWPKFSSRVKVFHRVSKFFIMCQSFSSRVKVFIICGKKICHVSKVFTKKEFHLFCPVSPVIRSLSEL